MKRVILASLALALLITITSCNMSANQELTQYLADNGYNMLVSTQPASLWNSKFVENLRDEAGKEVEDFFSTQFEDFWDADIEDFSAMTLGLQLFDKDGFKDIPENLLFLVKGDYDDNDIEDFLQKQMGVSEFEEEDKEDVEYFLSQEERQGKKLGYAYTREIGLIGFDNSLEDAIDVMHGKEQALTASENFAAISTLVDPAAQFTFLVWDLDELQEFARESLNNIPDLSKFGKSYEAMLEDFVAIGFSLYVDENAIITLRFRFATEESCDRFHLLAQDFVDLISNSILIQIATSQIPFEIDNDELIKLMKAIAVAKEPLTVGIRWEIPGDSPLLKFSEYGEQLDKDDDGLVAEPDDSSGSIANPMDDQKRMITLDKIRQLGTAIELYSIDSAETGVPQVYSVEELANLLIEKGYLQAGFEGVDGWGNPLMYRYTPGNSMDYSIISYGSDGNPGPEPQMGVDNPAADIIWENGSIN
jgi:hypothetical protein